MIETITHFNIAVSGFPFQKITKLSIVHRVNEHAEAVIEGELDSGAAKDYVQRVDESTIVTVTTTAQKQPSILFCGCVKSLNLMNETEYSKVQLVLSSTSCRLDVEKKNKTYQNTAKTYGQIITANIKDIADLHMMVSDKAIGALIMQYNETDWEFGKRMASQLKAPFVTNITSERPQIYVGLPPASQTKEIEATSYSSGSDTNTYQQMSASTSVMQQDFSEERVKSYAYVYLGDMVLLNGKKRLIKGVTAELSDGILELVYSLLQTGGSASTPGGGTSASTGNLSGIAVPATPNVQSAGKMMKGIVKAVSKDKVQVHLTDIDKGGYDEGGSWWFPYSTAYSSSDGSGWYCMPKQGDQVRIFFPVHDEKEGYAITCAEGHNPEQAQADDPMGNPNVKDISTPAGNNVKFTENGIELSTNGANGQVLLTNDGVIKINGIDKISFWAGESIKISADKQLNIWADSKVTVQNDQGAEIVITEDELKISGTQVHENLPN